jgi:sec-independent protein translocase protein TatB
MFDIGFAELILVGVVSLLVIGPERLPEAIRTARFWLNRMRRGFDDLKREVEQELHNDDVMQELRKTGQQLRQQGEGLGREIRQATQPPAPAPADGGQAREVAPPGGAPAAGQARPPANGEGE